MRKRSHLIPSFLSSLPATGDTPCLLERRHLLRIVVLFEVDNQDVRALARKGDGDCTAYPAVTAGDDDPLALQPARALVAVSPRYGRGSILAGEPGIGWC